MVEGMSEQVDRRDHYTGRDTQAGADLTYRLAEALAGEIREVQQIGLTGHLHQ
jgi:hypothetical protein